MKYAACIAGTAPEDTSKFYLADCDATAGYVLSVFTATGCAAANADSPATLTSATVAPAACI